MLGQRIGYIRVSTLDQHVDRQLEGIEVDKTFIDKASGKDTETSTTGTPDEFCAYRRHGYRA